MKPLHRTVFVRLIDGTDTWIPVKSKPIQSNQFELLSNSEFEDADPMCLFEFYPGDIVETEQHLFSDSRVELIAKRLIQAYPFKDREYLDFKFKAVLGQISINKSNAEQYQRLIRRIIKEKSDGQNFYPSIIKVVEDLNKL